MSDIQKPFDDSTWIEPDSEIQFSKYPFNHVQQTESGHSFEMDDTPGHERIRLQHRIGNYTEIQSDGTEIHKIIGDGYEITAKNQHVLIKGYCTVTVEGDSILNVKGDVYQKIEGNVNQEVNGDMNVVVDGETNLTSKSDININAGGLEGEITLNSPFSVQINSDLNVDGSITCSGPIYSAENVVATKKLYSLGGISTLGGLNVGVVDTPVMLPGVINSSVAINVPTVNALVLNDLVGPVFAMRYKYDLHKHPAPKGITGTPTNSQLL